VFHYRLEALLGLVYPLLGRDKECLPYFHSTASIAYSPNPYEASDVAYDLTAIQ